MSAVFGVYIGCTTTSVAVFKDGKTEIIANEAGDRVTPAVVMCSGKEKMVAISGQQSMHGESSQIIKHVKSIVSQWKDEEPDESLLNKTDVKLVYKAGELKYEVEDNGKNIHHNVEEILCVLYEKMMETASRSGGEAQSHDAVITVPFNFNERQREIMSEAAENAGFNVLRIITEPAATLLSYKIGEEDKNWKGNCLIYRIGGKSLDITLVNVCSGMYTIVSSVENDDLGGDCLTSMLVDYLAGEFKKQYKADAKSNKRSLQKLRNAAENCKRILSTMNTSQCSIESLYDGIDLSCNISRARFESLVNSVIPKFLSPFEELLNDTGRSRKDISKVILCGGTMKIPKLQQSIQDQFPTSDILCHIPPDEVAAIGAACQASFITNRSMSKQNLLKSFPALPFNIYAKVIGDSSDSLYCLIPKWTIAPFQQQFSFSLLDGQTSGVLEIYEGDDGSDVKKAKLIGRVILKTTPESSVVVSTLHLKRDGSLHVSGCDKNSSAANVVFEALKLNVHSEKNI